MGAMGRAGAAGTGSKRRQGSCARSRLGGRSTARSSQEMSLKKACGASWLWQTSQLAVCMCLWSILPCFHKANCWLAGMQAMSCCMRLPQQIWEQVAASLQQARSLHYVNSI